MRVYKRGVYVCAQGEGTKSLRRLCGCLFECVCVCLFECVCVCLFECVCVCLFECDVCVIICDSVWMGVYVCA